jgi:hypothetical protein
MENEGEVQEFMEAIEILELNSNNNAINETAQKQDEALEMPELLPGLKILFNLQYQALKDDTKSEAECLKILQDECSSSDDMGDTGCDILRLAVEKRFVRLLDAVIHILKFMPDSWSIYPNPAAKAAEDCSFIDDIEAINEIDSSDNMLKFYLENALNNANKRGEEQGGHTRWYKDSHHTSHFIHHNDFTWDEDTVHAFMIQAFKGPKHSVECTCTSCEHTMNSVVDLLGHHLSTLNVFGLDEEGEEVENWVKTTNLSIPAPELKGFREPTKITQDAMSDNTKKQYDNLANRINSNLRRSFKVKSNVSIAVKFDTSLFSELIESKTPVGDQSTFDQYTELIKIASQYKYRPEWTPLQNATELKKGIRKNNSSSAMPSNAVADEYFQRVYGMDFVKDFWTAQ